jgi:putative ATP-dependent endonuclease of OLD family
MYLSNLRLWNFRKFGSDTAFSLDTPNLDLNLNPGLNVLIGENDSGKSAIIDSIRHVLKTHSYDWIRIDGDDFHIGQCRLRIELTLRGIEPDEGKNFTEFLSWESAGEAVTPALRLILDIQRNPVSNQVLPYEVRAGADADGKALSPEAKEYLKVTYLKPLRDAKEELIARKNSRLSQILIGHEAFKGRGDDHLLIGHLKDFNSSIENYFDGKDTDGNEIEDQRGKDLKSGIDAYIQSLYEPAKSTGLAVTERGQLKSLL